MQIYYKMRIYQRLYVRISVENIKREVFNALGKGGTI